RRLRARGPDRRDLDVRPRGRDPGARRHDVDGPAGRRPGRCRDRAARRRDVVREPRPYAPVAHRPRRRLTTGALNGRLRPLPPAITPLRLDRDFRWLWSGQVVTGIGTQITRVALPYQVFVLTGSTLAIAALTLFQLVPILLFALGAGSLADAVDRRKL